LEDPPASFSSIAGVAERLLKTLPNEGRAQAWPTNQRLDRAGGASRAHADRRANQGVRGHRVIPDSAAPMARLASRARKANPVLRANLALKAKPVRTAKPALRASQVCREHAANKAYAASKVHAVKWDHAVKPDRPGNCPRSNR